MSFLDIQELDPTIVIDLKYATADNFVGYPLYSSKKVLLHAEVAKALLKVQKKLQEQHLSLKIWDAYRPLAIQQMMWDLIQDERYISNPAKNKGRHTRGTAVDCTLINESGEELLMPTKFDEYSETSHSDYQNLNPTMLENRTLLQTAMKQGGFEVYPFEWWHFDYSGWLNDQKFPPQDFSL